MNIKLVFLSFISFFFCSSVLTMSNSKQPNHFEILKLFNRNQLRQEFKSYVDTGVVVMVSFGVLSGAAGIYTIASGVKDVQQPEKKRDGYIKISVGSVVVVLNTALVAGSIFGYSRVNTWLF